VAGLEGSLWVEGAAAKAIEPILFSRPVAWKMERKSRISNISVSTRR
jgi:hypothetical protein